MDAIAVAGAGVVDEHTFCYVVKVDARPRAHTGNCEITIADGEVDPCVADADTMTGCPAKVNVQAFNDEGVSRRAITGPTLSLRSSIEVDISVDNYWGVRRA